MRAMRVTVLAVLAAVCGVFLASSAAGALTVSPAGSYSFTADGNTNLALGSLGGLGVLECEESLASGSIASDGTGSFTSVTYDICANALLGTFVVRQLAALPVRVYKDAPNLIVLLITVPSRGIQITSPSLGCSFTVRGNVRFRIPFSVLPHTVTGGSRIAAASSNLEVDSVSGGTCAGLFPVGLTGTYTGTYVISRSATITG